MRSARSGSIKAISPRSKDRNCSYPVSKSRNSVRITDPAGFIYKITPAPLWHRAQEIGRFTGAPVDVADGFIHFSSAGQVAETAAKHFAGQEGLLLVSIDPARLGPALKWEVSRGGALFPHLYGDLPLAAVVRVVPMRCRADGQFDFEGILP